MSLTRPEFLLSLAAFDANKRWVELGYSSLFAYLITVPRSLLRKLEQARAALSHSHPGASGDVVLEVGLDLILERQAKRRGLVKKPRKHARVTPCAPRAVRARGSSRTAPGAGRGGS